MSHFAGGKGLSVVKRTANRDGAADAGAIGQAEKVGAAGCGALVAFTHGSAVYIVVDAHRYPQFLLQQGLNRQSGKAGKGAGGGGDIAFGRVDLAGKGDAHRLFFRETGRQPKNGLQQRFRPQACLGGNGTGLGEHTVFKQGIFDKAPADVQCQNFHESPPWVIRLFRPAARCQAAEGERSA